MAWLRNGQNRLKGPYPNKKKTMTSDVTVIMTVVFSCLLFCLRDFKVENKYESVTEIEFS